jgi:hypothetical protein
VTDGRRVPAEVATSLLAAALAGIGAATALALPDGRILALAPVVPPGVLFGCFLLAFVCSELALLHVELRREAYSFSLSGVALLLGVLFCDAQTLILVRVAGAALVFAWQRLPPLKAA